MQVVDDVSDVDMQIRRGTQQGRVVGPTRNVGLLPHSNRPYRGTVPRGQLFQSPDDIIGHIP